MGQGRRVHPMVQVRKNAADEREAKRAKRSNDEQVAVLDARLGAGQGAAKERARLAS